MEIDSEAKVFRLTRDEQEMLAGTPASEPVISFAQAGMLFDALDAARERVLDLDTCELPGPRRQAMLAFKEYRLVGLTHMMDQVTKQLPDQAQQFLQQSGQAG